MRIIGLLLGLLGLILTIGGGYLASLGGSIAYLGIGLIWLITSFLIFRQKNASAYLIYALGLAATLIWAYTEVGLDWWPLAARTGLPLIFGLALFIGYKKASSVSISALGLIVAIGAVAVLGSIFLDQHKIEGELNTTVRNSSPDLGNTYGHEWSSYGGTNYGQRFSPLTQITPDNASELELAWQIQTGDVKGPKDVGETTYQATPLKLGNTLYICTPHNWVVALDADTGEKRWIFDAKVPADSQRQHQTCRGVSFYPGSSSAQDFELTTADTPNLATQDLAPVQCDAKLYLPTSDARLIAIDPKTGARCEEFAKNGELDLMQHMPYTQSGYYYSTSPPVVSNGIIVVAGAVNDNYDINSPSGVIRGFDATTGELKWNWDSANPDKTAPLTGDEVYAVSSPNSWSVASADEKLGLVYLPMGNRTPDQLGMYRNEAEEKYSSSVVALDIHTGKARWVQQFVHHDLWDMDTPAQPTLVDLNTDKGLEPALVVPTKQGDVYVLNRETGEPILDITEESAPQGAMEGDFTSPTQPSSALSFNPPALTEKDMWGASLIDQMICRIEFNKLRYEGRYTPPSKEGSIVYPGNFGVFNWGGIAVDPKRQVMFGMPLNLAFISTVVDKEDEKFKTAETNLGEHGLSENKGAPYAVELKPFLSPIGVPCQAPPWGYVAGADLTTGEIAWKHKNGTVHDMTPLPIPFKMGVPGIGGPIITDSGVVFMGASVDNYLRAYDLTSGEELWKGRLPAGGQATPMTYLNSQGEQMVVIVAGGHGSIGTDIGDYVLAFKLKK